MQRASKTRNTASPVAPISIIRPAWESYTKLKSLGAGSGGQVYLVRGVPSKGGVPGSHVVKRMFLHNKEQELRQAANEIHLLRILKHPNMVDYVDDFFDDEGYLNIVMEYCEAGDLAQYIHDLRENGTKLTLSQVIYYAFQLITGVHYLHSVNILHRDLKPNNIFLTEESTSSERTLRLKIADFGISRTLSPDALAETVVGTPHYLSPEVCESAPYTNKADIWSLGVVLYELAAQQKPFEGTNLLAVVRKITSGRYTPLSGEYEPIQSVLSKMLVVDPAARASAQELECYFFTSGFVPRARADGGIKKNEGQNGGASCRILGAQPAPNVAVTPPKLSSPDDTEYDDHSFEEEDEAQYGDDFC